MYLEGSGNPAVTFHNNTIEANTRGSYFSGLQGNFNASVFSNAGTDLQAVGSSRIDAYNTTFDKEKTTVSDSSSLSASWYLGITVTDPSLSPVEGASVTVTNESGAIILSGTTGPDGKMPQATLLEWTKNASTAAFHTPFLLNATKPAVGTNETGLTFDRSMDVTLILQPALPVAHFTANVTDGIAPLDVLFNDTSTGSGITGYGWIFSDDPLTVYTDRNITHTFSAGGIYDVNHSVTNEAGTYWRNMTGFINVTTMPPNVTGISPMGGIQGTTVQATITGTWFIPPVQANLTRTGMENITGSVSFANMTLVQGNFTIPASAATGGWNVTVTNADGQSGVLAGGFWVTSPVIPSITSISPKKKAAGSPKFTLTVNGVNFTSSSIIRWSGSNRTTKYVSPAKLTAKITAKDVKKKGTKQVTVQNPGASGGLSNAKPFKVT
jgi:PKD repeat protein